MQGVRRTGASLEYYIGTFYRFAIEASAGGARGVVAKVEPHGANAFCGSASGRATGRSGS